MATPPTFVSEQETAVNATTPKSVGASISALNGDILVEVAGLEHGFGQSLDTPTGGTSVTRTQRASEDANNSSFAEARLWTAPITSDQSLTPSFSRSGGTGKFIGTALLFRGSDGVGAATSTNNGTGSGAPSLSITTTQDNSAIVVVVVDWNTVDGASRTWRTVNGVTPTAGNGYERSYALEGTGALTYYVAYYPDAGAAGAKTVGLSAPSTQRYVICAVEIKGTASGSVLTFAGAAAGVGALAATILSVVTNTATALGQGTASATLSAIKTLAGAVLGQGTLSAALSSIATTQGAASGTGTLSADLSSVATTAGAMAGSGTLAAPLTSIATIVGNLSGAGSLAADAGSIKTLAGSMAGVGTFVGILDTGIIGDDVAARSNNDIGPWGA